jgi:hypothetical protein
LPLLVAPVAGARVPTLLPKFFETTQLDRVRGVFVNSFAVMDLFSDYLSSLFLAIATNATHNSDDSLRLILHYSAPLVLSVIWRRPCHDSIDDL